MFAVSNTQQTEFVSGFIDTGLGPGPLQVVLGLEQGRNEPLFVGAFEVFDAFEYPAVFPGAEIRPQDGSLRIAHHGTLRDLEDELAAAQTGRLDVGDEAFRQRRSIFFKKMRIVRGCDTKRNVLVYLAYTDKLIEGSPQNSTSTVPIMPWGDQEPPRCADYLDE